MRPDVARQAIMRVFPGLETRARWEATRFRRLRRKRPSDATTALYYGGRYFEPKRVAEGTPQLHLCRSAITGEVRFDGEDLPVWVCGLHELRLIVNRGIGRWERWTGYSYVRLDGETVLVFPSHRTMFGRELAFAARTYDVYRCEALRES